MLGLWIVAALLAAGLTAALLIDRGSSSRGDVAGYIADVNATGQAFARSYRKVGDAYRTFTLSPERAPRELPRLRRAARELTGFRIRLQQIPAPPAARKLRALLVAFYRRQEAVAYELVAIDEYVPRLTAAERPLGPASGRMRAALAVGRTPEQQAAALGAYADALAASVRTLRRISPPAAFAASHRAQLAHLAQSARAVEGLQHALLTHSRARVKAAVAGLRTATSGKTATTRTAIAAYNRDVASVRRLGIAVERERLRLNRTLD